MPLLFDMKIFLSYTGRIIVIVSGLLTAWGFYKLYGKYSSPIETISHMSYGKLYVVALIVGVFMIMRSNRMPY